MEAFRPSVRLRFEGDPGELARLRHAAAIAGQEAKARVYGEQVQAFAQQVTAAKTAAETKLAVAGEENRCKLDQYKADVTRFEAQVHVTSAARCEACGMPPEPGT